MMCAVLRCGSVGFRRDQPFLQLRDRGIETRVVALILDTPAGMGDGRPITAGIVSDIGHRPAEKGVHEIHRQLPGVGDPRTTARAVQQRGAGNTVLGGDQRDDLVRLPIPPPYAGSDRPGLIPVRFTLPIIKLVPISLALRKIGIYSLLWT